MIAVQIIGMALATDNEDMLKDPISKSSCDSLVTIATHYVVDVCGVGMAKMAAMKAYKEAGNHGCM